MKKNVCNFIPYHNDYHSIHTINFVYETEKQIFSGIVYQGVFKVHFVKSGKGILHLQGKTIELSKGDVFFTFPGVPFCIESVEDFTYLYISFLGTRSNLIMEKLKISSKNFHFPNCDELFEHWKMGLDIKPEISDLITESILLYTFYYLGDKLLLTETRKEPQSNVAMKVKKYIDDNYSESELSLEYISKNLSYSPKYISSTFKKQFNIGISDYITTVRIQHACTLINQGFTSIQDIANQCGYSDAQYFSKVFKKRMEQLPREYIKSIIK